MNEWCELPFHIILWFKNVKCVWDTLWEMETLFGLQLSMQFLDQMENFPGSIQNWFFKFPIGGVKKQEGKWLYFLVPWWPKLTLMIHLPALVSTKQIKPLFKSWLNTVLGLTDFSSRGWAVGYPWFMFLRTKCKCSDSNHGQGRIERTREKENEDRKEGYWWGFHLKCIK